MDAPRRRPLLENWGFLPFSSSSGRNAKEVSGEAWPGSLFSREGGKKLLSPMAVRKFYPGKKWRGAFLASLPLPKVQESAKGRVFWLQCAVFRSGRGLAGCSSALGYCVLRAPSYKETAVIKKYGRIDFFMGVKPPRPSLPRYGDESVKCFKDWLKKDPGITLFQSPVEGRKWLEGKCPRMLGK